MPNRFDFSPLGRSRVVLVTILGPLACLAVALAVDSAGFGPLNQAERVWAVMMDTFLPIGLGVPAFFFFSSKLRELAIAQRKLEIYASTDNLTSLLNRGAFIAAVKSHLAGLRREDGIGALLVIDVDHFKFINDRFGHDQGDEALKLIAGAIKNAVRSIDIVGRLGGEEFWVFLPSATPLRAELIGERLRAAVGELEFKPDGMQRQLSVSVGGATFDREVPFPDLYGAADRRLYIAKQAGRNCVSLTSIRPEPVRAAA